MLVGLDGLITERSLREALAARVSPESLPKNVKAFEAGLALGAASRVAASAQQLSRDVAVEARGEA